jgi:hypothetical protein
MIAIEILMGLVIVVVILTGIVKIGGPLADAFAHRLKLKFEEIGPEEERLLKTRISALEEEVRRLEQQVIGARETAEFAVKLLEARKEDSAQEEPQSKKKS